MNSNSPNRVDGTIRAMRARGLTISLLALAGVAVLSGCDELAALFGPSRTFVRLVNDSDHRVDVLLIRGGENEQDAPRELLEEIGDEERFSLGIGEARTASWDCDEIQAVFIDNAELMIGGTEIGPEADTGVLRDGDEYGCGDVIEFRFDHSGVIVDFDVAVSVIPR